MTQILNVPMPADNGIDIINWMLASNSMIIINVDLEDFWNMVVKWLKITQPMQKQYGYKRITINSITPIIPTYSVWDRVMILATGEIGSLQNMLYQQETGEVIVTGRYMVELSDWRSIINVHRSEICKIA